MYCVRVTCTAGYSDIVCRHVAIYLNPLVTLSQLVTCLNREVVAHLVIFWLIPISAMLMVGSGSCCGCCNTTGGCAVNRSKEQRPPVDDRSSEQQCCNTNVATCDQPPQQYDCVDEETDQQPQQHKQQHKQQKPTEETRKKGKGNHNHHSRHHDKHEKATKNDNTSNMQAQSSGVYDNCRQSDPVICGYETQVRRCADCSKDGQCRLTKSQFTDGTNRSSNARDDDDESGIRGVVKAFRLSQMASGGSVHFDDQRRAVSADVKDKVDGADTPRTDTNADRHAPRTASCDVDCKRRKDNDGGTSPEEKALIVSRSSTAESKQRTANDNVWAPYHEDRCSEYNNSDERDEQLKKRT